ncbi:MAG: ATP phosphoribosyltransferase [Dinghuibacter sp.]|nr:ATP phosphoribosyltransferase [Dinghuibacter sp.]
MSKLKIAIQKNGRLNEKSLGLLLECGIRIPNGTTRLRTSATNFPVEVLFLRDDDIPQYVEQQVADVGILGENEVLEKDKKVSIVEKLGFANCRLSLAIRKEEPYTGIGYFNNKKVATSYPKILGRFFEQHNITAEIEEISGSVEIAPGIGLADAVCDIVSTGSTLFTNGLKEVDTVIESQAVLIASEQLSEEKAAILNRILFRIKAVRNAREHKYIMLNAPNSKLKAICDILPGMNSPTIIPLAQENWSSLHSVIKEDQFWEVITQLKEAGAEGILVSPIEKMIY